MMITRILLFCLLGKIICTSLNKNMQMLSYSNPGSYILTKDDYNDEDIIFFEIWGSGGGGDGCYGGGGGGGNYLSGSIEPNSMSFNITVGKGGIGCYSGIHCTYSSFFSCNNGTSSSIVDFNTNKIVNITVGGGYGSYTNYNCNFPCGLGGKIISYYGATIPWLCDNYNQAPQIGQPQNISNVGCTFGGNGGQAIHGGIGGIGSQYGPDCDNQTDATNGIFPGGGGGGTFGYNPPHCTQYCKGGDGADGLIIIYFGSYTNNTIYDTTNTNNNISDSDHPITNIDIAKSILFCATALIMIIIILVILTSMMFLLITLIILMFLSLLS